MTGNGADLLGTIVAATIRRVADCRQRVPEADLEARAGGRPEARGLRRALAGPGLHVIAECKRRSPSRGMLRADYDPAAIAAGYARAGAAAVSVLTEPSFFDGDLGHLELVRDAVPLPILRKDFVVDEYQLLESRASGADAALLIVAALEQAALVRLLARARALGLDALVEVHADRELDRALEAGADLVGVNHRDLRTLDVDLELSARLAPRIPPHVVAVAESGLRRRADLERLGRAGFRGFLIGEHLMSTADPGAALSALVGGSLSP